MRDRFPLLFVTLAAACGSTPGPGNGPDGGMPQPTYNVKVTVHPGPVATDAQHYPVQFLDKDGKLVVDTVTDDDGIAIATIPAGASVTVIGGKAGAITKDKDGKITKYDPGGPFAVKTVLGLQPGDDIQLDLAPPPAPEGKSLGDYTVGFAARTGATRYQVTDACSGGLVEVTSSPAKFPIYKACDKKVAQEEIVAFDATGPIAWSTTAATALKGGGTAGAAGDWVAASASTTQIDNLDAAIDGVAITRWSATGFAAAAPSAKPAGASLDVSLPVVRDIADGVAAPGAVAVAFTAGADHRQFVVTPTGKDALSVDLDASKRLLPWIDAPTFDLAKRTLHTPVRGAGAGDLFEAKLEFTRALGKDDNGVDMGTLPYSWTIIAADGRVDLTLPRLVLLLDRYNPAAGDTVKVDRARIVELEDAAGYDQARQAPSAAIQRAEGTGSVDDTAAGHGARSSVFGQ